MTVKGRGYTVRTGGGVGALDKTDGALLVDGDPSVVFSVADSKVYFYRLDADSGAVESDPTVISPDTNAGDKRHLLVHPYDCPKVSLNGSDYDGATLRGNIGCDSMATQSKSSVDIDGGDIAAAVNIHHSTGDIDLSTVTANGDILVCDGYTPVNVAPRLVGGVTTSLQHLTSILSGVDDKLTDIGGGLAPQSYLVSIFGGNGTDGNLTVSGTTTLTANNQYNEITVQNGGVLIPGLGCEGIIARKITVRSGGEIRSIGVDGTYGVSGGGVNPYVAGTYGDGGNGNYLHAENGEPGHNGTALAGGGGGGGASNTYSGGKGGDGADAGGAGGAPSNSGSNGTAMSTPASWQDLLGTIGGGGGAGGVGGGDAHSGAGGSAAKFLYIEAVEVDLQSGGLINSYGGVGGPCSGTTNYGAGGGGAGGGILVRCQISTAFLSTMNVNGGAGGTNGYDGGKGGLGLIKLEHVEQGSSWGYSIAHYDYAVDGGTTCVLSQELPDNADVIHAILEIITAPDSAGEGASVALGYETPNDLMTATVEGSLAAGFHDLIPNGTAAHMIKINGAKGPTVTITGEALTSGEFYILSTYAVTE